VIRINTDELDRLSEIFLRLKSDTDNILGKTNMLRNEMFDDDRFMSHPKCGDVVDIMDWTVASLTSLNDDICSVEILFQNAKERFVDNEKELVREISYISNKLDSIRNQLDATITSNQVVVVDRSDDNRPVNEVEQLVSGSVNDLELVNISALSVLARQEAEARQIEDK